MPLRQTMHQIYFGELAGSIIFLYPVAKNDTGSTLSLHKNDVFNNISKLISVVCLMTHHASLVAKMGGKFYDYEHKK